MPIFAPVFRALKEAGAPFGWRRDTGFLAPD
jgi:hypothetical protein